MQKASLKAPRLPFQHRAEEAVDAILTPAAQVFAMRDSTPGGISQRFA